MKTNDKHECNSKSSMSGEAGGGGGAFSAHSMRRCTYTHSNTHRSVVFTKPFCRSNNLTHLLVLGQWWRPPCCSEWQFQGTPCLPLSHQWSGACPTHHLDNGTDSRIHWYSWYRGPRQDMRHELYTTNRHKQNEKDKQRQCLLHPRPQRGECAARVQKKADVTYFLCYTVNRVHFFFVV